MDKLPNVIFLRNSFYISLQSTVLYLYTVQVGDAHTVITVLYVILHPWEQLGSELSSMYCNAMYCKWISWKVRSQLVVFSWFSFFLSYLSHLNKCDPMLLCVRSLCWHFKTVDDLQHPLLQYCPLPSSLRTYWADRHCKYCIFWHPKYSYNCKMCILTTCRAHQLISDLLEVVSICDHWPDWQLPLDSPSVQCLLRSLLRWLPPLITLDQTIPKLRSLRPRTTLHPPPIH